MNIKVAMIQFKPETGELDNNIHRIGQLLEQVKDAQLIVLPELASSGYHFLNFDEAFSCSESLDNSIFVDFLIRKAKEKNAWIVSGVNEKAGDKLFNSSVILNSDGIHAKYRKTHLFMDEKDIFQKGDGRLPVIDIGGCKVGMTICFDYLFPEIWRIQAMNGADIICHPSNLLTQNAHRCIPGLSLMNRVYIMTTNRIGEDRGLTFNGQSFITDPHGEVLIKASVDREEVLTTELDMDVSRNKWITPRNHAFEDRRPDVYTIP